MKRAVMGISFVTGLSLFLFLCACSAPIAPEQAHAAVPRALADSPPNIPRLTGVNWFGFESSAYIAHGLWIRDYRSMLKQMKDLGFNAIRIPWSNEMLDKSPVGALQINAYGSDPYTGVQGINTDLAGLTSLQILDKIIDYAATLGLRIILDNHSRKADGYYNQTLWYTSDFSESRWIADWQFMATRYRDKPNVVAYDLSNEPHGGYIVPGMSPAATWGFDLQNAGGPTDWKAAAERAAAAIMAIDSDVILIVQGVQDYQGTNYWWGSNLRGIKTAPVTSIPKNRLMYSVHEYGPEVHSQDWFQDPSFPANLPSVWRDTFWFIYEQNIAGLYIGEMGIKEESASNPASIPYKWFTAWLQFAGDKVHFTYWAWNPNSGDTGGILKDDWLSVNPAKYALVQPYLAAVSPSPSSVPTPTPAVSPSPVPSATPSPQPSPNPSAQPSPVPSASPQPSPSSVPAVLNLQYQTTTTQTSSNTIAFKIKVSNSGSPVPLSALKIRYYFTNDTSSAEVFNPDYSGGAVNGSYQVLTNSLTGAFTSPVPVRDGASRYLELGFAASAPTLGSGGSFEAHLRITNQNWQNYNQSNDYSFLSSASAFCDNPHLVLVDGTTVVSGNVP